MIAALYVMKDGPYFGLPEVVPFDREKDARSYNGPYPVVAHPPCERWGRYWSGGPSAIIRRHKGDDGGCFDRALWAVRNFGGVLEHPANSSAWRYYRLGSPNTGRGWIQAGDGYGAFVCQVHQGNYGHRADKATWLYAKLSIRNLPELNWRRSDKQDRLDEGFHSSEERLRARSEGRKPLERLSKFERSATPILFRDLLISIAEAADK